MIPCTCHEVLHVEASRILRLGAISESQKWVRCGACKVCTDSCSGTDCAALQPFCSQTREP